MRTNIVVAALLALACGTAAVPAWAVPAELACQGGKNELAGKYAGCRAKAEKKFAVSGDTAAYNASITKCQDKYAAGWAKLESKATAAGGSCVDVVAENDLRDFVAACTDVVADVAAGGTLPVDVVTCNTDLTTCDTNLTNTENNLTTCETDLAVAQLCGNGAIDMGEQCDLGTLNGATCVSQGFIGGVLSCDNGCVFDTSGCYNARFVDNANGTITDNYTGLMWEKKVKLDSTLDGANLQDADNYYGWSGGCSVGGAYCQPNAAAEAACLAGTEGNTYGCAQCMSGVCNVSGVLGITAWQWLGNLNTANFGGHNDWRLPKKSELLTLMDDADVTAPLVNVAFHGASCGAMCTDVTSAACSCTRSGASWAATTSAPAPNGAWTVSFSGGIVGADSKPNNYYLRAVRGGS